MKILYLPGFSEHNLEAAEQLQKDFAAQGLKVDIIKWEHWRDGTESFKLAAESEKVLKAIGSSEAVIIAKSVGTRLIAGVITGNLALQVKYLVLMGVPSQNEVYTELFKTFPAERLMIIQNRSDPHGHFADVARFAHAANPGIKMVQGERSDHSYPFADIIIAELKRHKLV